MLNFVYTVYSLSVAYPQEHQLIYRCHTHCIEPHATIPAANYIHAWVYT